MEELAETAVFDSGHHEAFVLSISIRLKRIKLGL